MKEVKKFYVTYVSMSYYNIIFLRWLIKYFDLFLKFDLLHDYSYKLKQMELKLVFTFLMFGISDKYKYFYIYNFINFFCKFKHEKIYWNMISV